MHLLENLAVPGAYIDISALNLATLHQLAPVGVSHSSAIIICQQLAAIYSSCLAVNIKFLEGSFIYCQRGNAGLLHLGHNILSGHAFTLGQLYYILIIHYQLNGIVSHFYLMALEINGQGCYQACNNQHYQQLVILKALHISCTKPLYF